MKWLRTYRHGWRSGDGSGRPRARRIGTHLGLSLLLLLALVASSLPAAAAPADAGNGKDRVDNVVREFASRHPSTPVPVLVHRQSTSTALSAIQKHGGRVKAQLKIKNAVAADVPADKLDALAREPGVLRISYDAPVQSQGTLAAIESGALQSFYPQAVRSAELWSAPRPIQGSGVTVAVLDSGIDSHPDFAGVNPSGRSAGAPRIVARINTASRSGGVADDFGHGTYVAGVIGGRGVGTSSSADDGRYVGIAPNVNLLSIKVSGRQGVARVSNVIDGIEWAVAHKDAYKIRVLNISLQSTVAESYKSSLLDAAVEMAWLKGLVVVTSAGNREQTSILYPPANDPYVITVGATDDHATASVADDRRVFWSDYGNTQDGIAKPDLVAPGRRIVSTLSSKNDALGRQYPDRITSDGQYIRMSGTSASAAIVSGVVAQILEARPNLKPDQVKWLLKRTALAVPGPGTGAGYPQAAPAVAYSGPIERANRGLVPNRYVALAGYAYLVRSGAVTWDAVTWDAVTWDAVTWDAVTWDAVTWDAVTWDAVTWDSVTWDSVTWDSVTWDSVTWDSVTWDTVTWDAVSWDAVSWD